MQPQQEIKFDVITHDAAKVLPVFSLNEYIAVVAPLGREIEKRFGINHVFPIIQSAHESRYGNSGLARRGLNLFGIKSTKSWALAGKKTIDMMTGEYENGKWGQDDARFRAYESWWESFEDWAQLMTKLALYADALELMRIPDALVGPMTLELGFKAIGKFYATDPKYADKIVSLYRVAKF